MKKNKKIKDVKPKLSKKCKQNDIVFVGIFGSFLRDDFDKNSDLDLLVKFSKSKTLLDLVRIERELSESLGLKVDLLTENAISPYLIDKIKKELEVIYDEA